MDLMDESHVVTFLKKYAQEILNDVTTKTPPFFLTIAKLLVGKTPLGRIMSLWSSVDQGRSKGKR